MFTMALQECLRGQNETYAISRERRDESVDDTEKGRTKASVERLNSDRERETGSLIITENSAGIAL